MAIEEKRSERAGQSCGSSHQHAAHARRNGFDNAGQIGIARAVGNPDIGTRTKGIRRGDRGDPESRLRSGEDFVKIYGKCLTRNADLKIQDIRAAEGLAVTVKTGATDAQVEAYNGFVTVNAGKGPIKVMVVSYGSQVVMPLVVSN